MTGYSRRFDASYRDAASRIFNDQAIGHPFMIRSNTTIALIIQNFLLDTRLATAGYSWIAPFILANSWRRLRCRSKQIYGGDFEEPACSTIHRESRIMVMKIGRAFKDALLSGNLVKFDEQGERTVWDRHLINVEPCIAPWSIFEPISRLEWYRAYPSTEYFYVHV